MNSTNVEQSSATTPVAIKPGLFNGMLKQWQYAAFTSLFYAGVSKQIAHKIAIDYASDIGRAMATDGKFKSKIGKLNDDGERKIALAGASIITTSNSMSVVYVCQTLSTLFEEELLGSRKLPELSKGLQDYLDKCKEWADGQTWEKPKENKE